MNINKINKNSFYQQNPQQKPNEKYNNTVRPAANNPLPSIEYYADCKNVNLGACPNSYTLPVTSIYNADSRIDNNSINAQLYKTRYYQCAILLDNKIHKLHYSQNKDKIEREVVLLGNNSQPKLTNEQQKIAKQRGLAEKFSDNPNCWQALTELSDKDYEIFERQINDYKTLRSKTLIITINKLGIGQVKRLGDLSPRQKEKYLALLLACGREFMTPEFQENCTNSRIIPKNASEYKKIVNELLSSIGKVGKPVTNKDNNYIGIIDEILNPESEFSKVDYNDPEFKIALQYQLKDFIQDVSQIVEDLPLREKEKVWDYFNFKLMPAGDGSVVLSGCPSNVKNDNKLALIKNPLTKDAINRIQSLIYGFTVNNNIVPDGHFITKENVNVFSTLVTTFPELYSIIGKVGNATHNTSLEASTFAELKTCILDVDFQTLAKNEQRALLMSILLRSIERHMRSIDDEERKKLDTDLIFDRLNITEQEKNEILAIKRKQDNLGAIVVDLFGDK